MPLQMSALPPQLLMSEIKQTFPSTSLACLLVFEQEQLDPTFLVIIVLRKHDILLNMVDSIMLVTIKSLNTTQVTVKDFPF